MPYPKVSTKQNKLMDNWCLTQCSIWSYSTQFHQWQLRTCLILWFFSWSYQVCFIYFCASELVSTGTFLNVFGTDVAWCLNTVRFILMWNIKLNARKVRENNRSFHSHYILTPCVFAGTCSAAWASFAVFLLLNVIGAAAWWFFKSGYFQRCLEQ